MGVQLKMISRMFAIKEGNIADKNLLERYGIDTIVNAANPTLRKHEKNYEKQSVNLAIHNAIDALAGKPGYFEKKIIKELGTNKKKKEVLCRRGNAVLTKGYKLCDHIIHVVGAEYDGETEKWLKTCSSSRVEILESCYYEIVNILKQHTEIKRLAIPIIGSGNYGFPFGLAARIAIAATANALIEWKTKDPEMFEIADIQKIYFIIYDSDEDVQKEYFDCINKIWQEEYKLPIQAGQKVVYQTSAEAHFRYMKEIKKYDEAKGYFSVAKGIRLFLMWLRIPFFFFLHLKDSYGKNNWKKRRQSVELLAILKIGIPLFFWFLLSSFPSEKIPYSLEIFSVALVIYSMCDTMTYLLILIVMADIQRPSANLIRSMLMLFVNYIEAGLDLTFLYWIHYRNDISFQEALLFGLLGKEQIATTITVPLDHIWPYLNAGIQFFFLSLVFGYLANHMHQRKFIS